MIDLAELNDIKRSVSTGPDHEKIKSEVMDTINMEITNLTNRIESGIVRSYGMSPIVGIIPMIIYQNMDR